MDRYDYTLLRALASAMHLAHVTELEAGQVTEIAALLQLPPEELPALVAWPQDERLVRLYWGGRMALTPEGRARAEGTSPPGAPGAVQIRDVEAGAT